MTAWFILIYISGVTSNGRKEHKTWAYQLKFMFAGEISSLPHACTRNCRGANCCDTAAPGTVPQTKRMDYWDLVTLIKDSCPERAVLSLSPGSIQRELSLPRQCVTTCVHNRAGNSTHCPVHQPRVPLMVALPHTSCAVLGPLPSHLNFQPLPISRG